MTKIKIQWLSLIEILGAVCGIAGSYCLAVSLGNGVCWTFLGWTLFIIANASWIYSAVTRKVMPLLVMNLFYMGSSIVGLLKVAKFL